MRQLTQEELQAIAALYALPQHEREIKQSRLMAIVPLGDKLPLIHQVLYQ